MAGLNGKISQNNIGFSIAVNISGIHRKPSSEIGFGKGIWLELKIARHFPDKQTLLRADGHNRQKKK